MFNSLVLLTLATAVKLASSHATIFNAHINGVDQGRGDSAAGYIRAPPNNSPLVDVTSRDMICNVNNSPVARTLSVKAGDKFGFEWHHNTAGPEDDIIDPSHQGPVLVYIAPTAAGTAGNGWVKIYEDGFDGSFAVDRLIKNRGIHSITIPDIPAGDYLLRAEIIALHEGFRLNGAQFYPGCVQIKVTSAGVTPLPSGSTIPGIYNANDPGILFDLYNGFTSYTIPGPPVWDGTPSNTGPVPSTVPGPTTLQTSVIPATTSTRSASSTVSPSPPPSSTVPPTGGVVGEWLQCGGLNYVGPTTCAAGLTCKEWNPYYAQCVSPSIL